MEIDAQYTSNMPSPAPAGIQPDLGASYAPFRRPPVWKTATGRCRRVGVELEFAGLDVASVGAILEELFAGELEIVSDYECRVCTAELGEFKVVLDFEYLCALGRSQPDRAQQWPLLEQIPESVVRGLAERIVPVEVVAPPLAITQLHHLEPMIETLRLAGAKGTRHSAHYAFGVHLNPELPQLTPQRIHAYIAAFVCLQDWLRLEHGVDWSRRFGPHISEYTAEFTRKIIAPGYAPDMSRLIDDYLALDADRNRALDLLPLFAHIDGARVRAAVNDPRVKARPTLHYRLPNCQIDEDGWSLRQAWEKWLYVEMLASQPDDLRSLCDAYHRHLGEFWGRKFHDWPSMCAARLEHMEHSAMA